MYCGMNYTGSSFEEIYINIPHAGDILRYYHISYNQKISCNMVAFTNSDFISKCAGVRGGWRRIANINISAGMIVRVSGGRPQNLVLASVEWPVMVITHVLPVSLLME